MSKTQPFVRIALPLATATSAYAFGVRPWLTRWGATDEEVTMRLPGDDYVPQPRSQVTRAVAINAPPSAIWPWLVQMGQERGGLYSYDWLENLLGCDLHSADRIVPEWQRLALGDEVWLVRRDFVAPLRYVVARIEPERALVLRTPGDPAENMAQGFPDGSWAFVLKPTGPATTRLSVRSRSDYRPDMAGLLFNGPGLEPFHFIMERKMLLGIKARAERLWREDKGAESSGPGSLASLIADSSSCIPKPPAA